MADAPSRLIDFRILDAHVTAAPSGELPFKIFEGEWSSEIPGYGLGHANLFGDSRMNWLSEQCGGFRGKRVLELGPLEGGHSYMMAKAGASVTSIELNTRAFLKCLIVQNALKFQVDLRLGDFRPYLKDCSETYDLLLANGVLYHLQDPVQLLKDAARVSRMIGIWTYYYDAEAIRSREYLVDKFDTIPRRERFGNRTVMLYRQSYRAALDWKGFSGGTAPVSYWLCRDSLLGSLEELGFKITIGADTPDHPNGPAMLLFASR